MPVRMCKNPECLHPYFMHTGAEFNKTDGYCTSTIRDEKGAKIKPCPCKSYDHDPASGPF